MTPGQVALATIVFRTFLVLALIGAVLYVVGGFKDLVVAPVQTELNVSRASNAGFKKAGDAQAAGVAGLKKAGDDRKAKSRAAVEAAGKPEFEAAARIQASPAPGATAVERAVNRINAELGL